MGQGPLIPLRCLPDADNSPGSCAEQRELIELRDEHALLRGPLLSEWDVHRSRYAHQPVQTARRIRLEESLIQRLEHSVHERELLCDLPCADEPTAVVAALRRLGARHRIPQVYSWVSQEADSQEVGRFLHAEGGPDHGFDDLVAMCQLGLAAGPKTELARNYWDEMGNGDPAQTHAELFRLTISELAEPPAREPTVAALRRDLLMSLFSVRHDLQHLMLGALAMVELQAGPRCELVLQGMRRVGMSDEAMRFYEVHARVDPTHGRDWLTKAVMPVVVDKPWAAQEIIRGAAWRVVTDLDFFECLDIEFRALTPSIAR